jgi:4'-phosphopantetheinyl transferase
VAGISPAGLRFDRTCPTCGAQHGRPTLPDLPGLHVSLSRTAELVAVAVGRLPVGVDVEERARTLVAGFAAVATHPDDGDEDPVRSWTRKEAALKALGTGLRADPASVRTPPDGIPVDLCRDGAWVTVRDVPVSWPGYLVAVAVADRADPLEVHLR